MSINATEADIVPRADMVLVGGNVVTMNPLQPSAEAIAVKGDIILKVGTNEEVTPLAGNKTKVMDLHGKTVVPGFIDAHIHVIDFGKVLTWIDLTSFKSIMELNASIRQRARELPDGKWIIGRGWDENSFVEKRPPTCADLDSASMRHPVILYHRREQRCVANSRALELAGVTKNTGSLQNGVLDKDERGELTGILRGDATDLVWRIVPHPDEEELLQMFHLACDEILQAGLTKVHWIVTSSSEISVIRRLRTEKLPISIYVIVPSSFIDEVLSFGLHKAFGANTLRVGGVMIFADGFLAAGTAALREPYSGDTSRAGKLLCSPIEMKALATKIQQANLDLIIHAAGDLAVKTALDVIESVSAPSEVRVCRLEQAALLDKELIRRMKRRNVTVSVQPLVVESEFSVWSAADHLGNERVRRLYPVKTLLKEGVRIVGGSDCPMEPLNPLLGIQAAVTREFYPEQRITVYDALRMYTIDAAHVYLEEDRNGSIEAGKLADFVVLSRDPLRVRPEDIGSIVVEITFVGGRIVHSKPVFPASHHPLN